MSATTLDDILDAMRTYVAGELSISEDAIVDYFPDPSKATSKPLYFMFAPTDMPVRKSGKTVRRLAAVFTGMILKVPGTTQDKRLLSASWGPFHSAMEVFSEVPVKSVAGDMREAEDGQRYLSLEEKKDRFVAATCGWTIYYDRKLGA